MKRILNFLKKVFNYNYCDTCGFTKDEVYLSEFFCEAGYIQCNKCIREKLKKKQ